MTDIVKNDLFYQILPEDYYIEKTYYVIASWVVIAVTAFFLLPTFFLFFIQIKNFLTNRTTNERFSRKKPYRKGIKEKKEAPRMDSTGSSMLSTTTSRMVEDIIREYGEPKDNSLSRCETILNIYQMCCVSKVPDQEQMYFDFLRNKEGMKDIALSINDGFDIEEVDSQNEESKKSSNQSQKIKLAGESGSTENKQKVYPTK
eukprot:CAMPEP_0168614200 /NCGR_PEP_ID=MMETSP0449_2-20121227/3850_1 /TAXON_ID=1082188 /ORGANISM="Strombidium rassoulzadegani, Strain ras09" /LENGTH=201 /DNA_ID=CAMNT_0008654869 /DNA_START=8 /DNA_END=613 /DNA_ORIENTATION=-